MKLPISPRLLACAGFVRPGERVADVGCDHGYLSIYLLQQGIASRVIASDIRPMPLQSAKNNALRYGFADRISFHLSDGVQSIPRDFDTLICAGMGGDTMVSILCAAPWLQNQAYRLILQCQSKTPLLRAYLSDTGWHIAEETVLRDGRFLYTIMQVCWQPDAPRLSPAQTYFPPALLQHPTDDTRQYHKWVLDGLQLAAAHRSDPELNQIIHEINHLEVPL